MISESFASTTTSRLEAPAIRSQIFFSGIPTDVDQTASGPNVDGVATHYGFFVQDEWRVNTRMTLSLGLRYELRPPFEDREENISNFLRDTANGDVVVPSRASIDLDCTGLRRLNRHGANSRRR